MSKRSILLIIIMLCQIFPFQAQSDYEIEIVIWPLEQSFSENDVTRNITLMVESGHDGTYTVYENEFYISGGNWRSNELITIGLERLGIGKHILTTTLENDHDEANIWTEITILTEDEYAQANSPKDQIIFIEVPEDFTYQVNSVGKTIRWIASTPNPTYYSIYDIDTFENGEWESNEPIEISADGYKIGEHTITLVLYNNDSTEIRDTVAFQVTERIIPIITQIDSDLSNSELEFDEPIIILLVILLVIGLIVFIKIYRRMLQK